MYFIATSLSLEIASSKILTISDCANVQAALYNLMGACDPAATKTLHDMQRNKCWTLSIAKSSRDATILRITFLGEQGLFYANLLATAASRHPNLSIGAEIACITDINASQNNFTTINTWADITREKPSRYIRFVFHTPAAITKQDEQRQKYFSLLPDPADVFIGLERKWKGFAGPELTGNLGQFLSTGGCAITECAIHSEKFNAGDHSQVGFVGHVVYACRKNDLDCIRSINWLSRFANFTGVGCQTARGMGATSTYLED